MKKFKKTLAWVLSLAMVMTMIPVFTVMSSATEGPYKVSDGTTYPTFAEALKNMGSDKTITLIEDVQENITVTADCTLDLNGHVLDGNNQGTVIYIKQPKKLTLIDNTPTGTHDGAYSELPAGGVVTGGTGKNEDGTIKGGGVLNMGGVFTMSGGTIYGNSAEAGGGIYTQSGKVVMNEGASISHNTAKNCEGGGIFSEYGIVELNNKANISHNTANLDGGGIYNLYGSVVMNDETSISHNTANGDGGGIFNLCDDGMELTKPLDDTHNYYEVIISGGSVTDNEAARYGGGIYNGAFLILENGEVSGNKITGTGTHKTDFGGAGIAFRTPTHFNGEETIFQCGSMILSGKVVIDDNTANDTIEDNLFMMFDDQSEYDSWFSCDVGYLNIPIEIGDNGLAEGSSIGITHLMVPTIANMAQITEGWTEDEPAYFFSDDDAIPIIQKEDGELYLGSEELPPEEPPVVNPENKKDLTGLLAVGILVKTLKDWFSPLLGGSLFGGLFGGHSFFNIFGGSLFGLGSFWNWFR